MRPTEARYRRFSTGAVRKRSNKRVKKRQKMWAGSIMGATAQDHLPQVPIAVHSLPSGAVRIN